MSAQDRETGPCQVGPKRWAKRWKPTSIFDSILGWPGRLGETVIHADDAGMGWDVGEEKTQAKVYLCLCLCLYYRTLGSGVFAQVRCQWLPTSKSKAARTASVIILQGHRAKEGKGKKGKQPRRQRKTFLVRKRMNIAIRRSGGWTRLRCVEIGLAMESL